MTDISLSRPIEPAKSLPKFPKLPRLGLGKTFRAIANGIGEAFAMAYVEPYRSGRRQEDDRI